MDQHATDEDLDSQIKHSQEAFSAAARRIVELMILEVRSIFLDHPQVATFSFDQDGDIDSFPAFVCKTADGEDIADDELDGVEAIAERWNEDTNPIAEEFLARVELHEFRREHFGFDAQAACLKLQGTKMDMYKEDMEKWAGSFGRHLAALSLDQAMPQAGRGKPSARM